MYRIWVFLLAVAISSPVMAQTVCIPHAQAVAELKDQWGETLRAFGVLQDGSGVVEIFAAKYNATWTILLTNTEKKACVVASGENWFEEPEKKKEKKV